MNKISRTFAAFALLGATLAAAPASAGWRGHGWGRHGGHGGAVAAGVLGALAIGAIAASAASAAPANCVLEKRPTYNRFGDFTGYRTIRVCD
jgi:hypothetical protein